MRGAMLMSMLRGALAWSLRIAIALTCLFVAVNIGLVLALFGPGEGAARLAGDWRRIAVAHDMQQGRLSVTEAFEATYASALGSSPAPEQIRAHVARDLEVGEPAVFDAVLTRYILERFGKIDGRTLPAGVYLAAGPIGPDAWPGPLVSQYLVFPRHGYLLVVPPRRDGAWPAAYEATASLRKAFRQSGDADALYAAVEPYKPGAYDFPKAGEPLHDLLLIADAPEDIARFEGRLRAFSRRLDNQTMTYRLLRRNSNSALACYLRETGLAAQVSRQVESRLLLRLRLPGIARGENLPC